MRCVVAPILQELADWTLGPCRIRTVHLSQRGKFDKQTGYYHCVSELPVNVIRRVAPQPVYILAGQSNMAGRCNERSLPKHLQGPVHFGIEFQMCPYLRHAVDNIL